MASEWLTDTWTEWLVPAVHPDPFDIKHTGAWVDHDFDRNLYTKNISNMNDALVAVLDYTLEYPMNEVINLLVTAVYDLSGAIRIMCLGQIDLRKMMEALGAELDPDAVMSAWLTKANEPPP